MRYIHLATKEGTPDQQADRISSVIVGSGRRFYPSESAFPVSEYMTVLDFKLRLTIISRLCCVAISWIYSEQQGCQTAWMGSKTT